MQPRGEGMCGFRGLLSACLPPPAGGLRHRQPGLRFLLLRCGFHPLGAVPGVRWAISRGAMLPTRHVMSCNMSCRNMSGGLYELLSLFRPNLARKYHGHLPHNIPRGGNRILTPLTNLRSLFQNFHPPLCINASETHWQPIANNDCTTPVSEFFYSLQIHTTHHFTVTHLSKWSQEHPSAQRHR